MFKDMISRLLAGDGTSTNEDSQGSGGGDTGPFRADGSRPVETETTDGPSSGGADTGVTPDLDQIFDLLCNRRRRDVLRYLLTESDRVEIGTLAVHIAACECDKSPGSITSQERKRVYIALYQTHLSKMADGGAVDYDGRSGLIEPGPAFGTYIAHLAEETPATEG